MDAQKELETLKTIPETGNAATDLHAMLQSMLQKLLSLLELQSGWIFLIDENGTHQLEAASGLPPALTSDGHARMCSADCYCLTKYREKRLTAPVNVMECKRLEEARENGEDTMGLRFHASVPLRAGERMIGLLNVASTERNVFSKAELAMLEAVCLQIGTAIERIRLTDQQQAEALRLQRRSIAADLHDSVNQLLFSLSLHAKGALSKIEDEKARELVRTLQAISAQASADMRALVNLWSEHSVDTVPFRDQLLPYAEALGLKLALQTEAALPPNVNETFLLIAKEALNNAAKHTPCSTASVHTAETEGRFSLKIQDDGPGFNYTGTKASIGLTSMKNRAERLHGTCDIQSSPSAGTTILVTIPRKESAT